MTFRVSKRIGLKPKQQLAPCLCGDPNMAHWSRDGRCVVDGCGCLAFRPKKTGNKYRAVKTTVKGETFQSKHEAKSITDLRYLLASGEADFLDIKTQVDFPFWVNGVKVCTYVADAVVTLKDRGRKRVYEPKGYRSPEYRIKRRLMQACYPEVEFVEVVR